jgi:hypothetical protein
MLICKSLGVDPSFTPRSECPTIGTLDSGIIIRLEHRSAEPLESVRVNERVLRLVNSYRGRAVRRLFLRRTWPIAR